MLVSLNFFAKIDFSNAALTSKGVEKQLNIFALPRQHNPLTHTQKQASQYLMRPSSGTPAKDEYCRKPML
jgi:hypothetical protein